MSIPDVIIDTGSLYTKVGLSSYEYPITTETAIGSCKESSIRIGGKNKTLLAGDQAIKNRRFLNMNYPVENGIVSNFEAMTHYYEYLVDEVLRVNSSEHNFILAETSFNPEDVRMKTAEIMFEHFDVDGLYMISDALLSLASTGRTTGVCVQVGDQVSACVPIIDTKPVQSAIKKSYIAGKELSKYLIRKLRDRGHVITTLEQKDAVRFFIETCCYTSLAYQDQVFNFKNGCCEEVNYEMPDGTVINIGVDRISCPEVLFNPLLNYQKADGVHDNLRNSLNSVSNDFDLDVLSELVSNIVVAGGSSLQKGFKERVKLEISKIAPEDLEVNVFQANGGHSTWLGAQMLSRAEKFNFISREDYKEEGPSIINSI